MKKFSFIKTRTGPEFTYPISDNAQWNKMHNPVSRTPHKALSSGFSLFIWKFVSISLGRDLNQRLPLLSWLSQYLLSSLKHQLLDSPDHTRIPNAISPLGYAEKLENQRTQREQKSAEKETTWFGGEMHFLTLRYTLPLLPHPVQVTRRTVGQFAQQGDGDVCRGHCHPAARGHGFAFCRKGSSCRTEEPAAKQTTWSKDSGGGRRRCIYRHWFGRGTKICFPPHI